MTARRMPRIMDSNAAPATPQTEQPKGSRDMTTRLEAPLRREIAISGKPYTLTITPEGLKLVPKGARKGHELAWEAFVSGEAALATALNASLSRAPASREGARKKPKTRRTKLRAV